MAQARVERTPVTLKSRSFWSVTSLGVRLVSNAIVVFVQARLLGVVDFGHLAFGLSCAAIWALFFDLGSILHALRQVAADPSNAARQIRADFRMRALLIAPLAAIACAVAWFLAPQGLFATFLILHAGVAVAICVDYNSAILRALGKYQTESVVSGVGNFSYCALAIAALYFFPNIVAAAISLLIGRCVGFAIGAAVLTRIVPGLLDRNGGKAISVRGNFGSTLPYAKDVIIANSMNQIDMSMAGQLFDPVSVGVYAVAFRIFQIINQFLGALANIFIPSLAANEGDRIAHIRVLNALVLSTLSLTAASIVGPYVGRGWLGSALGKSYGGLEAYLPLVGIATAARILAAGSAMALTGSGLQAFRVRSLIIGFILLVALGAASGVYMGLRGYIWSGAVTFAIMTVAQAVWFAKHYKLDIREALQASTGRA